VVLAAYDGMKKSFDEMQVQMNELVKSLDNIGSRQ
jgi:hypothetical protein